MRGSQVSPSQPNKQTQTGKTGQHTQNKRGGENGGKTREKDKKLQLLTLSVPEAHSVLTVDGRDTHSKLFFETF